MYLWPFLRVWSFDAPSWSGFNRDGFNRLNGILALCFLDFLALLAFMPRNISRAMTDLGAAAIGVMLIVVHQLWLDGSRGERFKNEFQRVPARQRSLVGALSAALFGAVAIWFFVSVPAPTKHEGSRMIMSCKDTSEVTAAACDAKANSAEAMNFG
jgi:hypothetical protein